MQDLYEVLGLAPGVDQEKIKAAYRELAKRFHPDVNVGSIAAERFKELNRAYQVLSDTEARAAYDHQLRCGARRPRRRQAMGVALTTFVLTVGLASMAWLWVRTQTASQTGASEPVPAPTMAGMVIEAGDDRQPDDQGSLSTLALAAARAPPEPTAPPGEDRHGAAGQGDERTGAEEPPGDLGASDGVPPLSPAGGTRLRGEPASRDLAEPQVDRPPVSETQPAGWTTYRSTRFGFALKYPGDVFAAAAAAPADGSAGSFVSRDGRATLRLVAGPIAAGVTVARYRRSVMEQRYAGAAYDYAPQQTHWFVLSGTRGDEMFYERVTFACDGRSMHGWQLTYPLAERAFYDRIVEEMHRGYRHGNGPGGRCGEGKRDTAPAPPQAGLKSAPPM